MTRRRLPSFRRRRRAAQSETGTTRMNRNGVRPMTRRMLAALAIWAATATGAAAPAHAQAKPEDVGSIDGLIKALYDVISGPAGQTRDWNRMKSLFAPGARMIPTRPPKTPADSGSMMVWSPDDYVSRAGPTLEKSGFFEREIG